MREDQLRRRIEDVEQQAQRLQQMRKKQETVTSFDWEAFLRELARYHLQWELGEEPDPELVEMVVEDALADIEREEGTRLGRGGGTCQGMA